MYYVEKGSRNLVRFNLTLNDIGTNDAVTLHNAGEQQETGRLCPIL